MVAVPFDTLELAEKLEQSGFEQRQARGVAAAFASSFAEGLATKQDIELLRSDIDQLRVDTKKDNAQLRTEIDNLRLDMDRRVEGVDHRLEAVEQRLTTKLESLEQRLTIRLGGMMVVAVGVLAVMIRVL